MTESEFFETYCADVFRLCYYMVQNRQDAEDLCQEVFVKALQKDFSSIEKQKQWLFAIAMNTCRTFLKRKKRFVLLEWFKQLADPRRVEEAYEEKERSGELARLLGSLPEHLRVVVVLRYLHDLKLEEVAAVLALPVGTVKSRCHRAIQLLQNQCAREDGEVTGEGVW